MPGAHGFAAIPAAAANSRDIMMAAGVEVAESRNERACLMVLAAFLVGGNPVEVVSCPACSAQTVIAGHTLLVQGSFAADQFVPNGTRTPGAGLSMGAVFRCCVTCGHVWTQLSPEALRAYIVQHGTELLNQQLEAFAAGPYRDLPDCAAAREAGEAVAELDTLILMGQTREATGRFRELAHATWDQALAAIPRWPGLSRAEKLALFGWAPKEPPAKSKATSEHPMRDPWLDG